MKTGKGPGVGEKVGVTVGVGEFVGVGVAVGVAETVQVGDGILVVVWVGRAEGANWLVGESSGWLDFGELLHPDRKLMTNTGKINCRMRSRCVNILNGLLNRAIRKTKFYAFVTVKNV